MPMHLSRRELLLSAPVGIGVMAAATGICRASDGTAVPPLLPHFPHQDPELVRRVVGFSHAKLDELKPLVEERPALANAATDWGFGDWETAIGAASHVGRPDIAAFLMSHGARPDIFTFAMLGNLAAVRAVVEGSPGVQRTHGPHGITLLAHAKAGGEAAKEVLAYLTSLGDADPKYRDDPVTDAEKKSLLGEYSFGAALTDRLIVGEGMGGLTIMRTEGIPRRLVHHGNLEFHPAGAAAVKVKFEIAAVGAASVTVTDAAITVRAERVPA